MSSPSTILERLDALPPVRILCVGDVALDRYVYGRPDRLSREAPVPIVIVERETLTLGCSGNVVRNLATLGGIVDMVYVANGDSAGQSIHSIVNDMPKVKAHQITDTSRPTTVKTRILAGAQHMLRVDEESSTPISAEVEQKILESVRDLIGVAACVIISDNGIGMMTPHVIGEIIKLAESKKIPVFIDPKSRDFSRYRGATFLTPNRKELSEIAGFPVKSLEDAERAARKLMKLHDIQGFLVKLDKDGVCLVYGDEPARHYQAEVLEVFDVTGAGDTVIATLALAMTGGMSVDEAAMLANLAGTLVVAKVGTATVTRQEIGQALLNEARAKTDTKIIDKQIAAETAERWRKHGYKVGFTNGCFDLLHPGHIASIRAAKGACDKLILGLNSDASVKRLKGEARPIQTQDARATILAALSDIDRVVIFGEDTPIELIKAIRPDVMVKGSDYTADKLPGADLMAGWGGKVVLVDLVPGFSTSSTVNTIGKKSEN